MHQNDLLVPAECATTSADNMVASHAPDRPKSICLFGLFGMDNYGNDGSLEAMLMFLRQTWPDARYACICIDPAKVRRHHAIDAVPISWPGFTNRLLRACDKAGLARKLVNWLIAINHICKFDVLIIPGTSTLCDYRANPFGAPYALFRWAAAARLCGTKLYFVSTGAGPIHRRLSRTMLTYVAKWAHYRSFRDMVSKDFLTGLGIDTRMDAVYPDLAFKLPIPAPRAVSAVRPVTVALGLMDYNGWQGHALCDTAVYAIYLTKMVQCAEALLGKGYRVRLLVGEIADQRAVADLVLGLEQRGYAAATGGAARIVAEPVGSLHDLMRQMQDTNVVVASRFHNVICALKLSKPTVAIGYEAKHDALMADFGLADFCQHIEQFDVQRLLEQIAELLRGAAEYEDMIRERLVTIHRRLLQQEVMLADAIQ
jgi:polysaccharide pyruvyl transferase WcaK-like protein